MQWDLTNYVKEHYTASKLNDVEFAKKAENALQFPVTCHNVAGARETLEIPSLYTAIIQQKRTGHSPVIQEILTRLERLESAAGFQHTLF